MTPTTNPAAEPRKSDLRPVRAVTGPQARERIARATRAWGMLTLGGILVIAALALWHLQRRGRLLRERLGAPRDVGLPSEALDSKEPRTNSDET